MTAIKKYLILLLMTSSLTASAQASLCQNLFVMNTPFTELPQNLRQVYRAEQESKTIEQIKKANDETLEALRQLVPQPHSRRESKVPFAKVQRLLTMMSHHPVVGFEALKMYEQSEVSIGYCFGRATFAHLILLKMGVQKESILKIWAVGEMETPKINWDFHVATITYSRELGWVAVDPNFKIPQPIDVWWDTYAKQNGDQRIRLYVTPAEKFSFEIGKYDRIQMGLDLDRNKDWYRHYFVDLMKAVREIDGKTLQRTGKPEKDKSLLATMRKAYQDLKKFLGFAV